MRKLIVYVAMLAAMGIVSNISAAQARDGEGSGVVKPSAEKQDAASGPEANKQVRDGAGSARGEEGSLGRPSARPGQQPPLMMAVTQPWAKDNADVQALVDKVVVDQKAALQAQSEHLDAMSKLIAASRGTDADALKAAHEAVAAADKKAGLANRALGEDQRALNAKLHEINPNTERPAAAPKGGKARPAGEGVPRKSGVEGGTRPAGEGGRSPASGEGGPRPGGEGGPRAGGEGG